MHTTQWITSRDFSVTYLVALEYNNPSSLVARGQQLAIVVELHTGDDVSCNKMDTFMYIVTLLM